MGKLFIISAPSGAGKTTLVNELLQRVAPRYSIERVVTYTSKPARVGERDGYDFHFVSPQNFEQRIKDGFFLEYSTAYEAYYGTPRSILHDMQQGKSYLLIIDRVGAQQILEQVKEVVSIWIYTKNSGVLKKRLEKRAREDSDQIKRRLDRAHIEMAQEQESRLYHYHILNDDFDKAATGLEGIVVDELCRVGVNSK